MTVESGMKDNNASFWAEIRGFFTIWDQRFEVYGTGAAHKALIRDILSGLIIALISIPFGVGFAIASGFQPEQGLVASALASILGGLLGGAKYQVYGPTAAFITVLAAITAHHDSGFLVLASLIAGVLILLMGVFRLGRLFALIPHPVIVGFTMGIAGTILLSQLPDLMGGSYRPGLHFFEKLNHLPNLFSEANGHALVLGMLTFFLIKELYKISIFIPSPLIAVALCTFISNAVWHDKFIPLIFTKYGHFDFQLFQWMAPGLGQYPLGDLVGPVISITFIAALESILSARMADRLAENKTPFQPNKELFGQGVVNMVVPLLNGFPCTGALARTATSIKVGAVSPLSSIFTGCSIVGLMLFFSHYLSLVPMASIAGLLFFVGLNMVKPVEVRGIFREGKFSVVMMFYTAGMTLLTDLAVSVGSATVLYYLVKPWIRHREKPVPVAVEQKTDVFTSHPSP